MKKYIKKISIILVLTLLLINSVECYQIAEKEKALQVTFKNNLNLYMDQNVFYFFR